MLPSTGPTDTRDDQLVGASDSESQRLAALESFGIFDTPPEKAFDDLTSLAAHICGVPMSLVSLVDAERQWFKARHGVDSPQTSRELSFCAHALRSPEVLEIQDMTQDLRFADHPMVIGDPRLRFYAGAPLITADGHALGALCVLDVKPGVLTALQRQHLQILADQVMSNLELRRQARLFAVEVSARVDAGAAYRRQQRMLDGVLRHTDVLIYAKDVDGRFVTANPAVERATRIEGGLIGRTDHDFFDAALADDYRRNDRQIMATREPQVFSEYLDHADGSVHTFRSTKFPLIDDSGAVFGIGGVSTDVTELARARTAHARAEARWRALVEQSPVAVIVVDANGTISYANPEAVTLCGAVTADELQSLPALGLVTDGARTDAHAMLDEILAGGSALRSRRGILCRLDGTEIPVDFSATVAHHSGMQSVQIEMHDVSAVVATEAALKQSATTDALTGLLNRSAWDARVESLVAETRQRDVPVTVAVIDLDNFKAYNDTRGHTAGDSLLRDFANVAGASLRCGDIFGRWGGEEFLVALPDTTLGQAEPILNGIRCGMPASQTCSIGYTSVRLAETLLDSVIRADKALYEAKSRGRNQLSYL
ncbi:MAG: diguanylate cyclase [Mycobacterium sp.]